MAAETLTNTFLPVGSTHGLSHNVKVHYLSYSIASAAVEDGDIWKLGFLPANVVVVGGWVATTDMDTGAEALDIDVGWDANGAGSATYTDPDNGITLTNSGSTASAAGLCNVGTMTGDGIAEVYQAAVNYRPIVLPTPLYFAAKTMVQLEANTPAGTQAAGTFGVYLLYYAI
jgi:hypothetical protein